MIKLPFYTINNRSSEPIIGLFFLIFVVSAIAQFLFMKISILRSKINFGLFTFSDTKVKSIAIIVQSIIICMVAATLIQIIYSQSYYTSVIKYTIILSSALSIFFISLLSMRFISWFKSSENSALLLFTISTLCIIANSIIVIMYSYFALLNVHQIMSPQIPAINNMMSNIPYIKNAYLISSTVVFISLWVSSIMILKSYSSYIGRIKFWVLMMVPAIYFISKYQFYQSWLSSLLVSTSILSPVSFFGFISIFEVFTNVLAAVLFGLSFWVISRKIKENLLKQYVQISGIAICLLFLSSQVTTLTLLPYPPFGLISISFASISGFLLFIGLYHAAIITSRNSVLRSVISKSTNNELKFIGSIGSSEMEQEIQKSVMKITKEKADKIDQETGVQRSLDQDDLKQYLDEILDEIKKNKKLNTK